jgi:hypothetical protein
MLLQKQEYKEDKIRTTGDAQFVRKKPREKFSNLVFSFFSGKLKKYSLLLLFALAGVSNTDFFSNIYNTVSDGNEIVKETNASSGSTVTNNFILKSYRWLSLDYSLKSSIVK